MILLIKQLVILGLNAMAVLGATLVVYGTISFFTEKAWEPLEKIADWLSAVFTLVATLSVAISAYLPAHTRPADLHSRLITAPIVISAIILGICFMIWEKTPLPKLIVNGFAILALSGALLRLLPFSEWQP